MFISTFLLAFTFVSVVIVLFYLMKFKKLKSKECDFGFHDDVLVSFSVSVLLVEFEIFY